MLSPISSMNGSLNLCGSHVKKHITGMDKLQKIMMYLCIVSLPY